VADPSQPSPAPLATEQAIRLARTGIRRGTVVRWLLILIGFGGVVLAGVERAPSVGPAMALGAALAWVMLVVRSVRSQQDLLGVPVLIEHRQQDQADQIIAASLRAFSIFRAPRMQALQHLASIRHEQRRSQDAAALISELLRYRLTPAARTSLLLLRAQSALELNDLPAVHAALSSLPPPASLAESMKLMQLQTDYCVRVGAWSAALDNLPWKVELAELLPTDDAAWVQGLLALAAQRCNLPEWHAWLQRRAELLGDRTSLVQRQPMLGELFA